MERGKISSLQMAIMMYPAIVATAILGVPSITAKYAKNDLWLSPLLASLFGYVTIYAAYKLHELYPKQTVIQFSEQIIGRLAGKMVCMFILFYYTQSTGLILRAYAEFVVDSFLIKTPISLIMASMAFLCACMVYGGLEALGRAAQFFLPFFIVPLLVLIFLLFPDYEYKNIFPILGDGVIPPIKGAIVPGAWFTEFFLITFLLPSVVDVKKGLKYGMMTVFLVMITLAVVNLVVLFVLGPTTPTKIYPLMNVVRYISLGHFFEHLESAIMAIWVVGAFIKISVFYYASSVSTAQWLNLSDYRTVVFPLGILIMIFGFWSIPNTMELARYNTGAFPPFALLIQTIIPLLLLVIAFVKKKKTEA